MEDQSEEIRERSSICTAAAALGLDRVFESYCTRQDTDKDGLSDYDEVSWTMSSWHTTDPNDADSDDDGLSDGEEEIIYGTSPNSKDSDGDGIPDKDDL